MTVMVIILLLHPQTLTRHLIGVSVADVLTWDGEERERMSVVETGPVLLQRSISYQQHSTTMYSPLPFDFMLIFSAKSQTTSLMDLGKLHIVSTYSLRTVTLVVDIAG